MGGTWTGGCPLSGWWRQSPRPVQYAKTLGALSGWVGGLVGSWVLGRGCDGAALGGKGGVKHSHRGVLEVERGAGVHGWHAHRQAPTLQAPCSSLQHPV